MRRHARQHDTNATIFNCNITNCSFKTLRSDKYIEHVKKYHPTEEQNATENHILNLNRTLNHTTTPIMVKTENNLLLSSTTINNPTTVGTLTLTKTENNTIKSEMELRLHETTANTNIKTTTRSCSPPTLVQQNTNFTNKTTTTTISIGTSGQVQTCLLTSSPFNTVSPPNKTVSDTYVAMNLDPHLDEDHFDEALMLAAANATEEDITNLVTPLLS